MMQAMVQGRAKNQRIPVKYGINNRVIASSRLISQEVLRCRFLPIAHVWRQKERA